MTEGIAGLGQRKRKLFGKKLRGILARLEEYNDRSREDAGSKADAQPSRMCVRELQRSRTERGEKNIGERALFPAEPIRWGGSGRYENYAMRRGGGKGRERYAGRSCWPIWKMGLHKGRDSYLKGEKGRKGGLRLWRLVMKKKPKK